MITSNKIQVLKESFFNSLKETASYRNEYSLASFIYNESNNDPNFFRWLFDLELQEDFDYSLSEEQKEEFRDFVEENELILNTAENLSVVWDATDPDWASKDIESLEIYNIEDLKNPVSLASDTSEGDYGVQYYQVVGKDYALVVWNDNIEVSGWYYTPNWKSFIEEYGFMFE